MNKNEQLVSCGLGILGILMSLFFGNILNDSEIRGCSIWFASYTIPSIYILIKGEYCGKFCNKQLHRRNVSRVPKAVSKRYNTKRRGNGYRSF